MNPTVVAKLLRQIAANLETLAQEMDPVVAKPIQTQLFPMSVPKVEESGLTCPKCGHPMEGKPNADGVWFWGCTQYPSCKGSRSMSPEYAEAHYGAKRATASLSTGWNDTGDPGG